MTQKDTSIVDLLRALPLRQREWAVVDPDPWDADLTAIGIARRGAPRRLVYISTFKMASGRYDYECEVPTGPDEADFVVTDAGKNVGLDVLLRAMIRHLAGVPFRREGE